MSDRCHRPLRSLQWMAVALGGGLLIACATAKPSQTLLDAREAYLKAEKSVAGTLVPADVHDAKVLLDEAEAAAKDDPQSPVAQHRAYLALRRIELAEAQGRTAAAAAQRDAAQKQEQALRDQQLTATRQKLAASSAAEKETQSKLSQTQVQLDAEHQARTTAEEQAKNAIDQLAKAGAVKEEPRGTVITLSGSVLFGSGKSVLLPSAQQTLDKVAEALTGTDRTILIEGHTDSRGSDAANLPLSQRRGEAVLEYLVARGVPRERMRSAGLGPSRPIADNASAEGRANNRRVEIVLEKRVASPSR